MPPIAILVALADPTRCRLIDLLQAGPQPVHVLAAAFRISRPAVSRHLRVLKQSGLISETKFGRENRYALHPCKLAPVQRWLTGLLPQAKLAPATAVAAPAEVAVAAPPMRRARKPASVPVVITPVPGAEPASAKPRPAAPVSQMGFDF